MYDFKLKIASVAMAFFMFITSSVGIVGWYRTPYAYAGINSFVSAGLSGANSVSNVEGPGEYHTQGENIYTLGSAEVRFNTVGQNLQLFTISPPNFSIGCSGIDATFGAFAMLGSDLMKALQSIIQSGQVLVFAFNMVLGVLCKQCEHIMNQIESIANKLNGLNFNSCQAAEAAGNIAGAEIGNMLGKTGIVGATNAFADSVNNALTSFNGPNGLLQEYINTINGVMNCASTPAEAQALVNSGFEDCGSQAAANKFQFGSLLRYALSQAHIGLIGGTTPGTGGANEIIGILRGEFVGDYVGYLSQSKTGGVVVRYVSPLAAMTTSPMSNQTITNTYNMLMKGSSNVGYKTINFPTATVTVSTSTSLDSIVEKSSVCFPGFEFYYKFYLDEIQAADFGETVPVSDTTSSVCNSIALTGLSPQELSNFISNSRLPVVLISKLAYVNNDQGLLDVAANTMASGYVYNLFNDILAAVDTNVMAAKNIDNTESKKEAKLYIRDIRTIIDKLGAEYEQEEKTLTTQEKTLQYYQNLNKQWVNSLSQFGLSGAYSYNP
ncbi:MAG: conjugal transfer protein TraH [bacterium]